MNKSRCIKYFKEFIGFYIIGILLCSIVTGNILLDNVGILQPVSAGSTDPPTVSIFNINNDASSTTSQTVTLNNVASNSPTQYMASENPSFSGATWQTYSTAPTFTLSPGNGAKMVYFKVKNSYGESAVVSDPITLSAQTSNIIFEENCNTFNQSKWDTPWNQPSVSGGTWVFSFPAGSTVKKQADYIDFTGYGTYEVRLRTSGPKVAGVNWWIFLMQSSPWNELDFAEIWGKHSTTSEYTITFWVDGKQTGGGTGYWYIDTLSTYGVNFEDGNFHTFKYVYSANDLIVYLDDIKIFQWQNDCIDKTLLGIPPPPMQFMIGGKGDGTQTSDWSLIVDYIKYYT